MTIRELEDTFIEDLNMLGDWFLQYEYLLELSTDMPTFPEEMRSEETRVQGCQSGAWRYLSCESGRIKVQIDSDALIIRGLMAIIVSLLNDRTPEEIVAYEPRFVKETNIQKQISTDRFNGIHAVIQSVQEYAALKLKGE